MSSIFLSHSSQDDFEAIALRDWLASEGWDDIFLDLDPTRGIAAGERWERALHAAATRCEAVVFLISRNWLASGWCRKEHALAAGLNKTLMAVIVDPELTLSDLPAELKTTWQVVSLVGGEVNLLRARRPGAHDERHVGFSRDGLARLRHGLAKAGLDPRSFPWPPSSDPNRAPYRGLKPMEAADAGVFFGREGPVIAGVDLMRGTWAAAAPRILTILGASGAGKSSFLRAGLLPRLAREDRRFLALAPIRPERDPLFGEHGLLPALQGLARGRTRGELRKAIRGGIETLRPILREAARRAAERAAVGNELDRPPALVLAIDQAEELVREDSGPSAIRFLELLAGLAGSDDPAVIIIFAIRSDSYDRLQTSDALRGIDQSAFPLGPMPRGSYSAVIDGPARRAREAGVKLEVDPLLTQRLLEELDKGGGADALPLLAVTLEELYLEYRQAGSLRLADYLALGELAGGINAAVGRALRGADSRPEIPKDPDMRVDLLRRGFIPWLAGVDPDSKMVRRNIAIYDDLPADSRPLLDLMVDERLLSIDQRSPPEGGAPVKIIEPAHEALLRHWSLLEGWLDADRGLLTTLADLQRASKIWHEHQETTAWLAHRGLRLREASALEVRPDLMARLDADARRYLAACAEREDAEARALSDAREREEAHKQRRLRDAEALAISERRVAQRTFRGLVVSLALLAAAIGAAVFAWSQWRDAREQARAALATRSDSADVARLARSELTQVNVNLGRRIDDLKVWTPSVWRPKLEYWRAIAHQNARDFAAERRDLDAELALDPNFAPALIASSDNFLMTGRAEFAARDAQAAMLLGAKDVSVYANLALADAMRRDWDAALADIEKALVEAPRVTAVTESLIAPDLRAFTGGFKLWVRDTDLFVALRYEKAIIAAMRGADFAAALDRADKADRDFPFSREAYLLALNWEWLILRGQARSDLAAPRANSIKDFGAFVAEAALWRRVAASRPEAAPLAETASAKLLDAMRADPRADYDALAREAASATSPLLASVEPASPLGPARDLEVRALEWAEGLDAYGDAYRSAPAADLLSQALEKLDVAKLGRPFGRREEDAWIDLRLRRAALRLRAGDRGGAIEDARAVISVDDKIGAAHALLGASLTAMEERRAEYDRALQLDPSDVDALEGLAWRTPATSPDAALSAMERARQFKSFESADWARLADLRLQAGDKGGAERAIDLAVRMSPTDAALYSRRRALTSDDQAGLARARDLHDLAKFQESAGMEPAALGSYVAAFSAAVAAPGDATRARELSSLLRDFNAFLLRRYGSERAAVWWRALSENPAASDAEKALAKEEARSE